MRERERNYRGLSEGKEDNRAMSAQALNSFSRAKIELRVFARPSVFRAGDWE